MDQPTASAGTHDEARRRRIRWGWPVGIAGFVAAWVACSLALSWLYTTAPLASPVSEAAPAGYLAFDASKTPYSSNEGRFTVTFPEAPQTIELPAGEDLGIRRAQAFTAGERNFYMAGFADLLCNVPAGAAETVLGAMAQESAAGMAANIRAEHSIDDQAFVTVHGLPAVRTQFGMRRDGSEHHGENLLVLDGYRLYVFAAVDTRPEDWTAFADSARFEKVQEIDIPDCQPLQGV